MTNKMNTTMEKDGELEEDDEPIAPDEKIPLDPPTEEEMEDYSRSEHEEYLTATL